MQSEEVHSGEHWIASAPHSRGGRALFYPPKDLCTLRMNRNTHQNDVDTMKKNTANSDLRKAGLKVTLPRISILEILEEAEQHHMSAEDVYKTLLRNGNEVGLATVYRVLTQFEAAGLVTRHHFDGGQAIFELDTGDNHDHIVCLKTGKVAEFKDEVIENRLEEIATELGYTLSDYKIVLYGEVVDAQPEKPRLKVHNPTDSN